MEISRQLYSGGWHLSCRPGITWLFAKMKLEKIYSSSLSVLLLMFVGKQQTLFLFNVQIYESSSDDSIFIFFLNLFYLFEEWSREENIISNNSTESLQINSNGGKNQRNATVPV